MEAEHVPIQLKGRISTFLELFGKVDGTWNILAEILKIWEICWTFTGSHFLDYEGLFVLSVKSVKRGRFLYFPYKTLTCVTHVLDETELREHICFINIG